MKVTKASLFFAMLSIIILVTSCSDKTQNIQKIEVGDIDQFGTSLLGKKVEFQGFIGSAYPCQLPANRGNQCLVVYKKIGNNLMWETAIIKDGAYPIEQYKDWQKNKKLLSLVGSVELRPVADQQYKENTLSPAFIAEKIEVELTPQTKTNEIGGSTRAERLKDFE